MLQVSVVSCSFRPGGIDILLAGMRDQTLRDFEVICVDRRYERRHEEVMALARQYGVNLIHVPECRRNGVWGLTATAMNTGIALARGRVIIQLTDWTYCPPGWLEAHLQHHESSEARYVLSPYTYYEQLPELNLLKPFDFSTQSARADVSCTDWDAVLNGEVIPEVCAFKDGPFDPAWLSQMVTSPPPHQDTRAMAPGPGVHYTWTHLKNESALRETYWKVNGVDSWAERGGRMSIDTEFGLQMIHSGVQLWWEPAGHAHCVNPRHTISRVMPFGDASERVAGRWNLVDNQRFFIRREQEITSGARVASPNPYTIEDLAQRLEPWRTAESIDVSNLDIPDERFFGPGIWPNTPYPARVKA